MTEFVAGWNAFWSAFSGPLLRTLGFVSAVVVFGIVGDMITAWVNK